MKNESALKGPMYQRPPPDLNTNGWPMGQEKKKGLVFRQILTSRSRRPQDIYPLTPEDVSLKSENEESGGQ